MSGEHRLAARRERLVVVVVVVLAALAIKQGFAGAGADALDGVLAPSCAIAGALGTDLVHEDGAGYVAHRARMIVGPSCAGVNFLVASWVCLAILLEGRVVGLARKLPAVLLALGLAYVATVVTNGVRIAIAAELFEADVHGPFLTREGVHRILGVTSYSAVLVGLGQAVEADAAGARAARAVMLPLACYLGVAIGLPLLHGAYARDPHRFVEHAMVTGSVAGAVALALGLAGWRVRHACERASTRTMAHEASSRPVA